MGVSVRQKGKDWYIFIRYAGERAAKKYESKEEAHDVAKAVRQAITLGQFDIAALRRRRESSNQGPAVPTLSDFFDKTILPLWTKSKSLSKNTADRYVSSFRIHILPLLGELPVNKIDREQIKNFVVSLCDKRAERRSRQIANEEEAKQAIEDFEQFLSHGTADVQKFAELKCRANHAKKFLDEPERLLSKDSIRNVIAALRIALGEAAERKLLAANPATRLGKLYREARSVRYEVDVFTHEEIPFLLNTTLTQFGFENYVVMLTALHTGLRSGEIAGLQWPDLDFRDRFLIVRRQLKRDGVHGKTKTKKMRKVDMSDFLLRELQALKKHRQKEYLARGKNEIPEWVFLSPGQIIWEEGRPVGHAERKPLDMDNWRNRIFWKACDKAEIRRRRLHDTRHTFASILLMNGESPAYVKEQLGHSSIKMTVDVYGHFIPGANRQAVNKLPSLSTSAAPSKTGAD